MNLKSYFYKTNKHNISVQYLSPLNPLLYVLHTNTAFICKELTYLILTIKTEKPN